MSINRLLLNGIYISIMRKSRKDDLVQGIADGHKQSPSATRQKNEQLREKAVHFLLVAINCFYAGLPTVFCTITVFDVIILFAEDAGEQVKSDV